jgi:hypothetical protein
MRSEMGILWLVGASAILLGCHTPSGPATAQRSRSARVEVRYDRARDETLVRITPLRPPAGERPSLIAGGTYRGQSPSAPEQVIFGFERTGPSFRYESCTTMIIGGDGQRLVEVAVSRDAQIGGGRLTEVLTAGVPFAAVKALSTFSRVTITLCGDTLVLSPEELESLRQFVRSLGGG